MKTRYRVLCETREVGSECVTARKEEKVRHVSPFLLTQKAGLCGSARASLRLRAAKSLTHQNFIFFPSTITKTLNGVDHISLLSAELSLGWQGLLTLDHLILHAQSTSKSLPNNSANSDFLNEPFFYPGNPKSDHARRHI